jgi:hypothetical protein
MKCATCNELDEWVTAMDGLPICLPCLMFRSNKKVEVIKDRCPEKEFEIWLKWKEK